MLGGVDRGDRDSVRLRRPERADEARRDWVVLTFKSANLPTKEGLGDERETTGATVGAEALASGSATAGCEADVVVTRGPPRD